MPFASIQIGAQAIKKIYEQTLSSPSVDFVCLSTNYDNVLGNWFDTDYSQKLYDCKRLTREILTDTAENRSFAATKPMNSQVRFTQNQPNQTDVVITDAFAALISYGQKPGVILIEDKDLIASLHSLFEFSWDKVGE